MDGAIWLIGRNICANKALLFGHHRGALGHVSRHWLLCARRVCQHTGPRMAKRTQRPISLILVEARRALSMSQREFGYAVGSSHRTAARWDAGRSVPSVHNLQVLARLLYPEHRELAAEVADAADETLESLGLEAPP